MLGDFNAKVGCSTNGEAVGAYSLRERNLRRDRLI